MRLAAPASRRLVLAAATCAGHISFQNSALATETSKFPLSWVGVWTVDRCLEAVEGDAAAAEAAWTVSGGTGMCVPDNRERYRVRFVLDDDASVNDWRFEICSRCTLPATAVSWNQPDDLRYQRAPRAVTTWHVESRIPTRTLSSFGAIERWRATTGRGGEALAMEIRRSYRPVNDQGNIEGVELIRTYRLPVQGELEEPTSTSRSSLTLRTLERPLSDPVERPTWDFG